MTEKNNNIEAFYERFRWITEVHGLYDGDCFTFSEDAVRDSANGEWDLCALELRQGLEIALKGSLSCAHHFLDRPYVRKFDFDVGQISIAVINQQAKDWYGSDDSIGSFDFIYESNRGLFRGCDTFLDLGGHQLVWSVYYAKTAERATVLAFEPSILNAILGIFNCLINGVIDRVEIVPFAVAAEGSVTESAEEADKMLIDFLTVPMKTCSLSAYADRTFDFVKVDIEGYEFELLNDATFRALVKNSKNAHFELHLGHLVNRSISVEDCISALKRANLDGVELYSNEEMYSFLTTCRRDGFYSFLVG